MKDPKSILITGGSSGIGEALLQSYAQEGITLAFNGRDEKRVTDVTKSLEAKGATIFSIVLDVRDVDGMKAWIEEVDNQSPIDLLIANAGIAPKQQMDLDEKTRLVYDINVYGVFNTIHPIIDRMKNRGRGQIAIISSLAGYLGLGKSPAYSSSKAAVKAYGRALRSSLAKDGIKVSVVCPGWVPSRITDQSRDEIPYMVPVDYAVKKIRNGLNRNSGLIAFPPLLAFLAWWFATFPDRMHDILCR